MNNFKKNEIINEEAPVRGVLDKGLVSKMNLKMQKLRPLTDQSKGYGTQVIVKACRPFDAYPFFR